jgi:tRNA (guanine-N7-)-methyltransferase
VDLSDHPPDRRLRIYGRRRGRPLRAGRAAALTKDLPWLAVVLPAPPGWLDPPALFPRKPREVWLEVGFGGGEHLVARAQANPDIGLIGCEPFINGVAALVGNVTALGLSNVRIHGDDARPLLAALPDGAITRAFVLFPDPWPKARHADRRFIGPANLPEIARVLADGAALLVASDDPGHIDWVRQQLACASDFALEAELAERPPDWPPTRYEAKALKAGRRPVYFVWRRRARVNVTGTELT